MTIREIYLKSKNFLTTSGWNPHAAANYWCDCMRNPIMPMTGSRSRRSTRSGSQHSAFRATTGQAPVKFALGSSGSTNSPSPMKLGLPNTLHPVGSQLCNTLLLGRPIMIRQIKLPIYAAVLFVLTLGFLNRPVLAQPININGLHEVSLNAAVNGFDADFKNGMKSSFYDLTFLLKPTGERKIKEIEVDRDRLHGDWDVDDNRDGMLQQGEVNNVVDPDSVIARAQRRDEDLQLGEIQGEHIQPTEVFDLKVTLDGLTTDMAKVTISPTNSRGGQILAALPAGLGSDFVDYAIFNETAINTLAGVADTNSTGLPVFAVEFRTPPGQPQIINAFAVDPLTDTSLGGTYNSLSGILTLPSLAAPGELIAFDVQFQSLSASGFTDFSARLSPVPEPTTLTLFSIGILGLLAYGWRPTEGRGKGSAPRSSI